VSGDRFADGRAITLHDVQHTGRQPDLHRRLGQQDSLWLLDPGGGGPPTLLTEFKSGQIAEFRWARDSKSVVFIYGSEGQDVVLITDFH